jgi:hypothetical protein
MGLSRHNPSRAKSETLIRCALDDDVPWPVHLGSVPVLDVDRRGLDRAAASATQMGRFETAWLPDGPNLAALGDLAGAWIDRVHARRPQTTIVLDMDSSVSETHGTQEGSAYDGHFGCTCYHPLFVFNQVRRSGALRSAAGQRA